VTTQWQRAMANRVAYRSEFRIQRPDGEVVHVLFESAPVWHPQAAFVGHVGTVVDVTERRRAERALTETSARLAEAQHVARLGNWECSTRGGDFAWSEEARRIFGLGPDQTVSRQQNVLQAIHPEQRELIRAALAAAQTGEA